MPASGTLFLASKSPRRRELLQQIGVAFKLLDVDVPEIPQTDERPADYVRRLAAAKAQAGGVLLIDSEVSAPVLGADTIVTCDDLIMEKPQSEEDAITMLSRLSGRTHQVLSAVSLYTSAHQATRLSVTEVSFRKIHESECRDYWLTGEPRDKAGAYAIQGLGAVFVDAIKGSYSGVVGLPIEQTIPLLKDFNVPYWQNGGWQNGKRQNGGWQSE